MIGTVFAHVLASIRSRIGFLFHWRTPVILLLGIGTWYLATSSLFTVSSISIAAIENQAYVKEFDLYVCTKEYVGQNIFQLNTTLFEQQVKGCSPYITTVSVDKQIPSTIIIKVREVLPLVKYTYLDKCYVYDEIASLVTLPASDCEKYKVTEVKNVRQPDNTFLLTVFTQIIKISRENSVAVPAVFEMLYEQQTVFVKAHYTGHTVLFPINVVPREYVSAYYQTVQGLESHRETYKEIDLRFDRVIVR